ncbi:MAG: hypothetical protein AAFY35_13775 [Pseudomonadota bacterium]
MTKTNDHIRPPKEERKNISLQLVALMIFIAFVAGGLIISYDLLAPAPDVQP